MSAISLNKGFPLCASGPHLVEGHRSQLYGARHVDIIEGNIRDCTDGSGRPENVAPYGHVAGAVAANVQWESSKRPSVSRKLF